MTQFNHIETGFATICQGSKAFAKASLPAAVRTVKFHALGSPVVRYLDAQGNDLGHLNTFNGKCYLTVAALPTGYVLATAQGSHILHANFSSL